MSSEDEPKVETKPAKRVTVEELEEAARPLAELLGLARIEVYRRSGRVYIDGLGPKPAGKPVPLVRLCDTGSAVLAQAAIVGMWAVAALAHEVGYEQGGQDAWDAAGRGPEA